MSECEKCGRDDGHYLGCPAVPGVSAEPDRARARESECVKDGCTNPRREAKGKGPAPKYCEEHSDPKNRK